MTKIDIFSGFLGAGKTTLIKKLIAEAYGGEKLVLIENEFGEIGIDGGFLREAGIVVNEMNSGCICCSLVGDFGRALKKVIEEYRPDRILIEPSGVGKLSDVIRAVEENAPEGAVLGSATAVVDAKKCRMYMKNFGEFFNDQVENAHAIVLSRTGDMTEEAVAAAVALLREHNPTAVVVTTPWEALTGEKLLAAVSGAHTLAAALSELMEEAHHHHEHGEECHCHEHHHEHGEECHCHEHHHEHGEECHCHEHHHEHGEECHCHEHHHEHGEECHCHEHHHEHGEECHCHEHHHEHGEECHCHEHHHEHGEECHCHEHHHHADEVFSSFGVETARTFEREELASILAALDSGEYGAVLRAKGILPSAGDEWLHFDYVPGEADVRYGAADVIGRLCVIGAELREDKLKTLFGV